MQEEEREFHKGCAGIRSDRASKDDAGVFRFETLKERDCHDTLCVLLFIGLWTLAGLMLLPPAPSAPLFCLACCVNRERDYEMLL